MEEFWNGSFLMERCRLVLCLAKLPLRISEHTDTQSLLPHFSQFHCWPTMSIVPFLRETERTWTHFWSGHMHYHQVISLGKKMWETEWGRVAGEMYSISLRTNAFGSCKCINSFALCSYLCYRLLSSIS